MKPAWLEEAVLYQIYPQSFQDSNGDGIGDFQGIISRLDYIRGLGVNVIWLNPCFDSPFGDAGYDVRDFLKVAPRYGSEADLVELFEQARHRGIRVVLDLVAGHTSIDHPWFVESAKGAENEYADRYIWMNRDFEPAAGPTEKNFKPDFFWHQPALNFGYAKPEEPWQDSVVAPGPQKNRQALKDIMGYWMDRGAAGFRVDMAASLVKNDPGFVETTRLWQELRSWLEKHYPENILVAEWSHPAHSIPAGFHLDFLMHFNNSIYPSLFFNGDGTLPYPGGDCYFDAAGRGQPWEFMDEYLKQLAAVRDAGCVSLPTANHDFQRPRCGRRGWEGLKPMWTFFMTQAGPPTIYYGDEIGMAYVENTPAKEGSTLIGVTAPNAGTVNGERAGTRTPMQWDASGNAGFSTAPAEQLYLPLDPDPARPNVADQEKDPTSFLNLVRNLVNIRKANPALGTKGDFQFLNPKGVNYPLVYQRKVDEQRCIIALNPSDSERELTLEYPCRFIRPLIGEGIGTSVDAGSLRFFLAPFAYGIFELSQPE